MEKNESVEQLEKELDALRRELREVKEQYAHATIQDENSPETTTPQSQEVRVGGRTRIEYPTDHPHIYTSPEMHRGEPTIRGSAISVRDIVERTRLGDSPERILQGYPHLSLAKIHDALSYYYDHVKEIEKYIRENEEAGWRALHRVST